MMRLCLILPGDLRTASGTGLEQGLVRRQWQGSGSSTRNIQVCSLPSRVRLSADWLFRVRDRGLEWRDLLCRVGVRRVRVPYPQLSGLGLGSGGLGTVHPNLRIRVRVGRVRVPYLPTRKIRVEML